jgi:hypothetical protein
VGADKCGDAGLVAEDGRIDPGVVAFVADDGGGAFGAEEVAVGLDLQVAIEEMSLGAEFGFGAFGKSDGDAGTEAMKLSDGFLGPEAMIVKVLVQLFVEEGGKEFVIGAEEADVESDDGKAVGDGAFFDVDLAGEGVLVQVIGGENALEFGLGLKLARSAALDVHFDRGRSGEQKKQSG